MYIDEMAIVALVMKERLLMGEDVAQAQGERLSCIAHECEPTVHQQAAFPVQMLTKLTASSGEKMPQERVLSIYFSSAIDCFFTPAWINNYQRCSGLGAADRAL